MNLPRKHTDEKGLIAVSRSAVEAAEDSREIAVKKLDEMRLANERQASADTQRYRRDKPTTRFGRKTRPSRTRRSH
jgi:hypothetical protein